MKTDFIEIFQTIRAELQPYVTLGFNNRVNSETNYDLWSDKNVEINGEEKNEIYFAAVIIYEDYVGFDYMPIYVEPEMKRIFDASFLELLKEESCFHIKKLDEVLLSRIEEALADGYRLYKEKGWV